MSQLTSHVSWTGLSGVYNIMDHYEHEQMRAIEYVSTMHKAMNGVENFPYYSPTHLLKEFSQDKLNKWDEKIYIEIQRSSWNLLHLLFILKTTFFTHVLFSFLPECLRSLCSTGPLTLSFPLNLPQSSRSSSPRCPWRCRSTCCPESTTLRSSPTSWRRTGASTTPSTAASNRSTVNFWEPADVLSDPQKTSFHR